MHVNRLTNRSLLFIAIALFGAFSFVHILCGDFPKGIDVLPDERRYLEIARSLFADGSLIMRGEPSDFQKILYPVSLFPALLFPDGADQIRMVNVLNSLYACSSIFPALLIARKVFDNTYAVAASMVLVMISPDLMYSMTFMSEPLYFPLTLWMVYACWRCFESDGARELALAAVSGALCYVLYLCKEVAWMFFIGFIAWYLAAALKKRRTIKRVAAVAGLFSGCFALPFLVLKLTLFWGLGNSYSQFDVGPLLNLYSLLFGFYALALDSVYFIVGFGVFPVLFLACTYRHLARPERDLLFFCLAALLVGLLTVVFTISMREDVGHVALRQHLRYVAPLAPVLLMLFVRQVARLDPADISLHPRRLATLVGVMAGFCALVIAYFGNGNLTQGFDFAQFHFMRWVLKPIEELPQETFDLSANAAQAISTDDGDLLSITPLIWAGKATIVTFTAIGTFLLLNRSESVRIAGGAAICTLLATFMVANSIAMFDYNRNAYDVESADVEQTCSISKQLEGLEDRSRVYIALDDSNTGPNNLVDTYLQDGTGAYSYVEADKIMKTIEPLDISEENPVYVLVNSTQPLRFHGYGAQSLNGDSDDTFTLYRLSSEPVVDEKA